jgi:hypothetical protein
VDKKIARLDAELKKYKDQVTIMSHYAIKSLSRGATTRALMGHKNTADLLV